MTWERFREVALRKTKTGKCSICGKRRSRTKKVYQTLNPFNKAADGAPKSEQQIIEELRASLDKWASEPLICATCEGNESLHAPQGGNRQMTQDGKTVDRADGQLRIYVASSWRNSLQPAVVHTLRAAGHEVYDFRNPREGDRGFAWSDIDQNWERWSVKQYQEALDHEIAVAGFKSDRDALDWADCGVLVMPCGRSAHLELGYLAGQGKPCAVLACEPMEPELMVKLCSGGVLASFDQLLRWVGCPSQAGA